jgi:hypothetical protein
MIVNEDDHLVKLRSGNIHAQVCLQPQTAASDRTSSPPLPPPPTVPATAADATVVTGLSTAITLALEEIPVRCCLMSLDYVSAALRPYNWSCARPLPHVPQAWFRGLPGIGDQHDVAQLRDMLKWPVELLKTAPDTARSGVSAPRQCSPASSNGTPASRGGSRSSFRRWCWSPWLWTSCLSPAPTPVPQRVVRQHDIDSTHHGCSVPGLGA